MNTQRGSRCNIERRRGRREIEVIRRRIGAVKRGETNLTSNQYPNYYPQHGTPRESHELNREEKGERGDRCDLSLLGGRKARVKRGENNQANNHTPK